jgi:hypothetical protein
MKHFVVAMVSLFALWLGACARTVLNQPVHREGDGWKLVVRKVTDGPNGFDKGDVIIKPGPDERFIWVTLTLRNDQQQARTFDFKHCDLDWGDKPLVPDLVSHDMVMGYAVELPLRPQLAAGESIDRRLVFLFPEGRSPTRLRCESMVVPLPGFQAK